MEVKMIGVMPQESQDAEVYPSEFQVKWCHLINPKCLELNTSSTKTGKSNMFLTNFIEVTLDI